MTRLDDGDLWSQVQRGDSEAAGRPHLPDPGSLRRFLPGLHAAAVSDYPRPGAQRPALRQHRRHAARQRCRAQDDARKRRLADASGNCTATPVDLTAVSSYKVAENDFMANGGGGYPNFASQMTTQDIMDQVAANYVSANSPLSPFVKAFPDGRINCADSNGATAPNCPALVDRK